MAGITTTVYHSICQLGIPGSQTKHRPYVDLKADALDWISVGGFEKSQNTKDTMGTLSDLGMASSGEKITIEHVLILSTSSVWEESIRRAMLSWGNSSRETLGILKVVGYGLTAYLVLSGIAKVIDTAKAKKDGTA